MSCYAALCGVEACGGIVSSNPDKAFRVGDFEVRPQQGRIVGPDREHRVQPKIIDVLLCLADHPDEVVPRETIHDEVWGNVIVTDDALNRCVSELRRVFGDKRGNTNYIETVPKRGYRLLQSAQSLNGAAGAPSPAETDGPPEVDTSVATIAVLPFENLTPDAPNAFLAEAIPTSLHSALGKLNRVRVSSRRSSFALRDSGESADELGKKLGVQYIVSGSVAEAGNRIRIIAEVDDADAGMMLWSDRFEIDDKDILDFERQLTDAVVGAFGGQRLRAEIDKAREGQPSQLDAWSLVQRARAYLVNYRAGILQESLKMIDQAIAVDPSYALAHAMHALLVAENLVNGLSGDTQKDLDSVQASVSKALELAPNDPGVLRSCGCAQAYTGGYRSSIKTLRRAIKLAPYDLGAWGYLGWPLTATGKEKDLQEVVDICTRLLRSAADHPGAPYWHYHLSVAQAALDMTDEAIENIEHCLDEQPGFALGLMHYANLLGAAGDSADANKQAELAADANSKLTPAGYAAILANLTDDEKIVTARTDGLRAAGLL